MPKFFEFKFSPYDLDHKPFKFNHKLLNHEALSLNNLSHALLNLPKENVMYSQSLQDLNANFDRAHIDKKNNLSLEKTLETIKTANSFIMVRSPEMDSSFNDLYQQLCKDVGKIMKAKGVGLYPKDAMLYLFIASPNAFTPFHIDRYSTFLFQFQGTKEVAIFDQFSDEIVPSNIRESFVDYGALRPTWNNDIDGKAHKIHFSPGEALHIPFVSGHYVKNGPNDVSISMSIIFKTAESEMWTKAMSFNHRLRNKLKYLGINLNPVGFSKNRDEFKSKLFPLVEKIF
jgi:hypothetical protein